MKRTLPGLFIAILALLNFTFISPALVSAQDPLDPVCTGRAAVSAACQGRTTENPLVGPNGVLTRVIQIIVMITAIAAVIVIIVGGLKYILSSGDPNSVNSAKNTILYAIIGLVVAVIAQAIVSFVLRRL